MSLLRPSGLKAPTKILKHGSWALKAPSAAATPVKKTVPGEKSPSAPSSETQEEFVDDFQVGERVWVKGNKPGFIQFLGETQFAPGQWAGIILDEPIGKNDGSVAGVCYFQCEPLKGIFTRPFKLSRSLQADDETNGLQPAPATRATRPLSASPARAAAPKAPQLSVKEAPATPHISNLTRTASESISNLSEAGSLKNGEQLLKLGDQVPHILELEAKMDELRAMLEVTDWEKVELLNQLEEEKRKLEDLRFRDKEASITRGNLEKEVKALQATFEKLAKENECLRTKLDHAKKENADVIGLLKSKLETAIAPHQQAMGEPKASLSRGMGTEAAELAELTMQMETLQFEFQQEVESLKAQQAAERVAHASELQMLRSLLFRMDQEQKNSLEAARAKLNQNEDQHLVEMEDALNQLQEAEMKEEKVDVSRSQSQALQAEHAEACAESQAQHEVALQALQKLLLQVEEKLQVAQAEIGTLLQEVAELKIQANKAKIDFLNSVIVDLQRFNQDLKMKVEMMSKAALDGNGDDLNDDDNNSFGPATPFSALCRNLQQLMDDITNYL